MSLPLALNVFLGPALILSLILADCFFKFTSNIFVKRNFCVILIIMMVSLFINFILSLSLNVDIMTGPIKFMWPAAAVLLLFIYLFVILNESKTDNLTGLCNRYGFFKFTGRLLNRKTGENWTIAVLDINNFKLINSVYGHQEGDAALCSLAGIIKKCAGKSGFVARYGGDEFALVINANNDIDKIIKEIIRELDIINESGEKPYSIQISYGAEKVSPGVNRTIDDYLFNIDQLIKKQYDEYRRLEDDA